MTEAQDRPVRADKIPIDSRFYLAPAAGAAWLAGIWLSTLASLDLVFWIVAGVAAIAGAIVFWRRGRVGLILAMCAALGLGGARYVVANPPADPGRVDYYSGASGVISGHVGAEPEVDDTRVRVRLVVDELLIDGQSIPASGNVLVDTARYPVIGYGARLRVTGKLEAPSAMASPEYAAYLVRSGFHAVMRRPEITVTAENGGHPLMLGLLALKDRGRAAIRASLPEPHAALLTGILLGDDSGLPKEVSDSFRQTGMTHIIAISGFNIALIIALLDRLTAPVLPRRTASLVIMLLIAVYAVLVGASASVLRAAVMGIAFLIGLRLLGRPSLAVAGLFVAAVLMTLHRPAALWDIGFQLSFAATLGLMIYATPWTRRANRSAETLLAPPVRRPIMRLLTEGLIVTLAAQVLTIPLLLYHFGRLSLASLPANLLVLPAQPAVMLAGGLMLLLGLAHPLAGRISAGPAWLFLAYTVGVICRLALLPGASVPLQLGAGGVVAVYLVIAALTLFAVLDSGQRRSLLERLAARRGAAAALGLALLFIVFGLLWLRARPDGRLHVAFLDVGQGDAVFIETPGGRQILIDGGRYPSMLLAGLGERLPFWDRSLDLVLATHPDADHINGLVSAVERYEVGTLITNGAEAVDEPAFAALLDAATAGGAAVHAAAAGETLDLGDGVRIEILHSAAPGAGNDNDASLVSRLVYGDLSLMLTGDASEATEADLLAGGQTLAATVLKAAHHGADSASSAAFLRAVAPQVIIISVGADNTYGHPSPAMLQRAADAGATVLRTDEMGTIELVSDGDRMWWVGEEK